MEQFLIGIGVMLLGILFTFAGYQMYRVLIPLWGFFAGFSWTAEWMAAGMGTGFLATLFSWAVALIAGVVIGLFAYLYYEFAVAVLVGSVGYWLVYGLFSWMGLAGGFIVTALAVAAGIAFAVGAIYFKVPKGLLIFFSAVGGATAAIGGFMVLFGMIPVALIGSGLMEAVIGKSFLWTLLWLAMVVIGVIAQLQLSRDLTINESTYYSMSNPNQFAGAKGGKQVKDNNDTSSSN